MVFNFVSRFYFSVDDLKHDRSDIHSKQFCSQTCKSAFAEERNAPINVKPLGEGGRPGIGGGFDVVGTFDHSLSSFD